MSTNPAPTPPTPPTPLRTPRTRMINFVTLKYDEGLTDVEIKKAAVDTFRNDPTMVEGALEFLAAWAMSDSQAIERRKAIRAAISTTPAGVFDALEQYLAPIDGRLLTVLDVKKVKILNGVVERLPVVYGELRHLHCIEEIANALPGDDWTPRRFFATRQIQLHTIINKYYGEES